MTDREKIIAEIERRRVKYKELISKSFGVEQEYFKGMAVVADEMMLFIKSLPYEQQSSSLDKFIHTLLETYPTNKNEVPIEALNDYHQGLICGARKTYNWILESAIDGCYIKRNKYNKENVLNGLSVTCDAIQKFSDGDKVKVIIVKEDEQ